MGLTAFYALDSVVHASTGKAGISYPHQAACVRTMSCRCSSLLGGMPVLRVYRLPTVAADSPFTPSTAIITLRVRSQ